MKRFVILSAFLIACISMAHAQMPKVVVKD